MKKTNLFKMAALTAVFALAGMFASAQTISTTDSATVRSGADGPEIKVIDNKGTVKYIQSNNGITTITSTVAGNQTRTTFQLGGTLEDSTYIDLAGNKFGLKQLTYSSTGRTYEFVVIDSITGEFRKQKITDLIDAGTYIDVLTADVSANTYAITLNTVTLESFKTVYVFRNGAKLIAGVDYTVTNAASSIVTLMRNGAGSQYTGAPANSYESYPLYLGDRIEIQFIK
jgi:hypothetical protein